MLILRARHLFALPLGMLLSFSLPMDAHAATYFAEVPGNPLGTEAEWTNYLRLADLDGDGDLDVIVPNCGGFFSSPQAQALRLYRNDGSFDFTDATSAFLGESITAPVRVVAVADIDGDGSLDLFFPSAGGTADLLYVNDGKGVFTDTAKTALPGGGTKSHAAAARFGDVDGDGDMDLLVGSGYAFADAPPVHLYLNDGSGVFTDATSQLPQSMIGTDPDDIDLIDVDRDFDLDILVNAHSGPNALWINDGSGTFNDGSGQLAPLGSGSSYHYGPAVCDVDGDGDLDIWVDNTGGNYTEQLLVNDGAGNFSDVTAGQVMANPGADDNQVACVDVDHDGDFDAVVASLGNKERVLRNNGAGSFSHEQGSFKTDQDPTLWFEFGDLNGDGTLDVVTGQGEGNPARNRVYSGAVVYDDNKAPVVTAMSSAGLVGSNSSAVVRFAVRDAVVSDSGPRLKNAELELDIDGAAQTVSAWFVGGDLFQAQIPGQSAGVMVSYKGCATDRQGNRACGAPQAYVVGQDPSSSASGSGAGGAGGEGGSGGDDVGAGGGGSMPILTDSGCGCRVPVNGGSEERGAWLVLVLGLAVLRSRRTSA